MAESKARNRILKQRPITRWGPLDDLPRAVVAIDSLDLRALRKIAGGRLRGAARVLDGLSAGEHPLAAYDVEQVQRDRLARGVVHAADRRLAITDVTPAGGPIMSHRPFALRVEFAAARLNPPRLVSVGVEWAGEPFVNERLLSADEAAAGYVDVPFDEEQTLPTGSAAFVVDLYNAVGGRSRFRVTNAVLPSNPFSMQLGPDGAYVTGTWSARGVRNGNAYDTGIALTLLNGNSGAVNMRPGYEWKFWDGGVGGSLVEHGNGSFGSSNFAVAGMGSWGGWISFHSPSGSGIFNKYNGREDMTIEIIMTRTNGSTVSATITARTMFRFGVNVTRVANEDFTSDERNDLNAAATRTRTIYEQRDMTFDFDVRWINRSDVGGYEIIDSFGEFHDLLDDWSGPDSNNNIDAFIVQAIDVGGGVDGIDGSVPGPTSHHGSDSGVIASKTGYVDSSGHHRLHSDYLGMLMGHELGHYLGLDHVSTANNLMLPSSGTYDNTLTYDQYRTMIRHGWVRID